MNREFTYYPVSTLPQSLDVVWCMFPDVLERWKPKNRPALVRGSFVSAVRKPFVDVAYGTSRIRMNDRRNQFDLIIAHVGDMNAAGLPQNTRFDLDNTLILPWCKEYFKIRSGYSTPIVGSLSNRSIIQLEFLIKMRDKDTGATEHYDSD